MSQLSLSGRKGVLMWGGFLQCCVGQKMYEKSDKEITFIVLYRISFKSRAQKYFLLLSNIISVSFINQKHAINTYVKLKGKYVTQELKCQKFINRHAQDNVCAT